jgi:hypothetical protein
MYLIPALPPAVFMQRVNSEKAVCFVRVASETEHLGRQKQSRLSGYFACQPNSGLF